MLKQDDSQQSAELRQAFRHLDHGRLGQVVHRAHEADDVVLGVGSGTELEHQGGGVVQVVDLVAPGVVDDEAVGDLVDLDPAGPHGLLAHGCTIEAANPASNAAE